ncbi:hypothetical protein WMY93_031088 [Mugilogobius chulae]|uniref:Uncharacterized protein n=1 Tax=Mugilogobius chulae TaxID=88201 RepID=A0AAW0MJF0_9GOBI
MGTDHLNYSTWRYDRGIEVLETPTPSLHLSDACFLSSEASISEVTDEEFASRVFCAFNSQPGTLTDGPQAFPYTFTVRLNTDVTFDDLVNYCIKDDFPDTLSMLPPRAQWGSVNPVLLMEDTKDADTGRMSRRYSVRAEPIVKSKVAEALTGSLVLVIVESLLILAQVRKGELEAATLAGLPSSVVELCSFYGIEAYTPLLQEMAKVSKDYSLLSYPEDLNSCGLCNLGLEVNRACGSVKLASALRNKRRISCIDTGPYCLRKCVRLPNCRKEDTCFEYIATFNRQNIEEPDFDEPLSLSVGLSSNVITCIMLKEKRRDWRPSELGVSRCLCDTGVTVTVVQLRKLDFSGQAFQIAYHTLSLRSW